MSLVDSFSRCAFILGAVRALPPHPQEAVLPFPPPQPPRLAHPGTYTEDSGVEQQGQGGQEVIGALLLDLCGGQDGEGFTHGVCNPLSEK